MAAIAPWSISWFCQREGGGGGTMGAVASVGVATLDRPGWRPADVDDAAAIIARKRESVLAETLGHYPAPLADSRLRQRGTAAGHLMRRSAPRCRFPTHPAAEPRNMIRTLFLGRLIMIGFARREAFPHPSSKRSRRYPRRYRPAQRRMQRLQMRSPRRFHTPSNAPAFDGVIAQVRVLAEAEPFTDGNARCANVWRGHMA